jgi:PEP-CTERM motif
MFKTPGKALLTALALSASAHAATLDVQTHVFVPTATNWESTLLVPQFDPALGDLSSVTLTLVGEATGSASVESLDTAPSDLLIVLRAQVSLTQPGGSVLTTTPTSSQSFAASAFDGGIDFAGTSGRVFGDLSFGSSESMTLTDTSLLAPYIGTDSVSLQVRASGTSTASGAGNVLSLLQTTAGASVTVAYDYTPAMNPGDPVAPVPEPGTYALMLMGLAWVGVVTRRRRQHKNPS